jgi:hypothetical protein
LVELADMDTVLSCNIGFVSSWQTLYHPSDMLIGMSRDDAIKTCRFILDGNTDNLPPIGSIGEWVPEQKICVATLTAKGCNICQEECIDQMKKYYRIVDMYFLDAILDTSLGHYTKQDFEEDKYFLRYIKDY